MKRTLALSALFFLLSVPSTYAGDAAPSYVELADAPTITVDWSKGNTQAVTLHGNRTFTFSNGQKGGHYMLILSQDATGSRLVKWPSSVRWPGATAPTFTTTAGKTDFLSIFHDSVNYYALALAQNY
jgi:hypothetical protein